MILACEIEVEFHKPRWRRLRHWRITKFLNSDLRHNVSGFYRNYFMLETVVLNFRIEW